MWSRGFLIAGLASGMAAAALALAALWFVLFMVTGSNAPPGWAVGHIIQFCVPGVIAYPACWYAVVFRRRDYSANRTATLVVITFGAVWIAVAATMFAGGVVVAGKMLTTASNPANAPAIGALAPILYAKMTILGAIILILPYLAVATPIAFLHRFALIRLFAPRPAPPVPSPAP